MPHDVAAHVLSSLTNKRSPSASSGHILPFLPQFPSTTCLLFLSSSTRSRDAGGPRSEAPVRYLAGRRLGQVGQVRGGKGRITAGDTYLIPAQRGNPARRAGTPWYPPSLYLPYHNTFYNSSDVRAHMEQAAPSNFKSGPLGGIVNHTVIELKLKGMDRKLRCRTGTLANLKSAD